MKNSCFSRIKMSQILHHPFSLPLLYDVLLKRQVAKTNHCALKSCQINTECVRGICHSLIPSSISMFKKNVLREDNSVSPEHYLSYYFEQTNLIDTVHYRAFVNSWPVIFLLLRLHPALCSATVIQRLLNIHCTGMCVMKSFPICTERKFNLKHCFQKLLLSKKQNIRALSTLFSHKIHNTAVPATEKEINCIPDKIKTAL